MQAVADIHSRLSRSAGEGKFSGAVLVALGDEIILEQAYGEANRDTGTPNTVTTRFRVGSLNKMFTATAVLQLEASGRLRLDETVGTYLTDYPSPEFARSVTLDQLLIHTAGAGNIFGPVFQTHRLDLVEINDYVRIFGDREPEFDPGEKFSYSNYGYIVLGAVIKAVSRTSYHQYMRDRIFVPLGMDQTDSPMESDPPAGAAIGYTQTVEGLRPNTSTLPVRGTPAGGGLSTVGDLLRFGTALLDNKLLGPATTRRLTTGRVPMADDMRYGYGFIEWTQAGKRLVGNMGSAPGMNALFQISAQDRRIVAILCNRDPPMAQVAGKLISQHLDGSGLQTDPALAPSD